jgi:hypothetical protein
LVLKAIPWEKVDISQYLILKAIPWGKVDILVIAWVLAIILWDKVDIKVSTWSSKASCTSRSMLGPQVNPLGQGGYRGKYLVFKTISWDKMDIEVSVLGPQDHPLGQSGHQVQNLALKTIPWDMMDI